MAGTAIQNIKILHKRYSSAQWLNGIQINGQTIIPTLDAGEIGFDITERIVKIGTENNQTWANAHLIHAKDEIIKVYKHADGSMDSTPKSDETYVLENYTHSDLVGGQVVISVYYISTKLVAPIHEISASNGDAQDPSTDEVDVVTAIAAQLSDDGTGKHEITATRTKAATKKYVDGKFSTTKTITVEKNPSATIPDDGSGTIEYVSAVKQSAKDHTIEYEVKELVLPSIEVGGNDAAGDYIASVAVDTSDDHKIVVTKGTFPSGTGGATAGDLEFIDSVTLSGHTLTATAKGIKGDNHVISVAKDTDGKVKITADTYTKAEIDELHEVFENAIDELGKSMEFAGTLASDGTGTVRALPVATDDTIGHVYKVAVAGTYNSKECKVGDMFICDNNKVWRYIPAGDETFTDTWRGIQVNGVNVKDNSIGGGDINFAAGDGVTVTHSSGTITIAHADTSTAEDLTTTARQYVNGLIFDEYGHVTGYSVGTETDQEIPNQLQDASGGETAGTLEFISKAELSKDASNNIVLSTDTKKVAATDKINVAESDSTITFKHDPIQTTTAADSSKDVTITAGGANKTFTVVDAVTGDGFGHITDVKTKTVTVEVPSDTDTTYDLGVVSGSAVAGETSAKINLTAGGSGSGTDSIYIKVDAKNEKPAAGLNISVSNDVATIGGRATSDMLGLIRAAYTMTTANDNSASVIKTFTGQNNDKLYGVNVKEDGTAFVEVPWVDTKYTASAGLVMIDNDVRHAVSTSAADSAIDMYAFGTDAYGHVTNPVAITTIDGNYA